MVARFLVVIGFSRPADGSYVHHYGIKGCLEPPITGSPHAQGLYAFITSPACALGPSWDARWKWLRGQDLFQLANPGMFQVVFPELKATSNREFFESGHKLLHAI
jgi:hypothetical protein